MRLLSPISKVQSQNPSGLARSRGLARFVTASRSAGILLVTSAILTRLTSIAQPPLSTSANDVKAAYLFNFTKYIEWPEDVFGTADNPIIIGVLGRDPFGPKLEEIIGGRSVSKRKVEVKRSSRPVELRHCQVIFISSSERDRLAQNLQEFKNMPVLTVSDMPGFLDRGGMVQFVLTGDKVRFDINLENAQRAGLKISSRMLAAARNVARAEK